MMNTRIWICFMLFVGVVKPKWRCKTRIDQSNHSNDVDYHETLPVIKNNTSSSSNLISCICGKQCKGLRGLKAHHRSCRIIRYFNKDIVNELNSQDTNEDDLIDIDSTVCYDTPSLKAGNILMQI